MEDALAPIWKALADPTRRRLLDLLRDGPRTTGALAAAFPALSRFAVMKHLGMLEGAGLVVVRPRGRERWHYLNAVPLQRLYERWVSAYQSQWASSLLGIQRAAEVGEREGGRVEPVQIEQEVVIAAVPARVFAALVEPDAWWHLRYGRTPDRITFEPKLGGRFYQRFDGDDTGVLWAVVTWFEPDKRLVLTGTLDMAGAIAGVATFDLAPHADGTLLKLRHEAVGPIAAETRASYTAGWQALLGERLKAYVERGERYRPPPPAPPPQAGEG
jgi:uncharacterized protein YndB with AHSA1/START domain/DNA-binding transcriptional ArsR family regulator